MSTMRRPILVQIASAVPFLAGAYAASQDGDWVLAGAGALVGVLNLGVLLFVNRSPERVRLWTALANAAFALVASYASMHAGKHYLPFAWLLAAILFAFLALRLDRRLAVADAARRDSPEAGGSPST